MTLLKPVILSFLVYKVRMMIVSTVKDSCEDPVKTFHLVKRLEQSPGT